MDPNATRGKGIGSRLLVSDDELPVGWRFERRSAKYGVWFDEHGRQYRSSKEVKLALRQRDNELETEASSDYQPSPLKKPRNSSPDQVTLPGSLFMTQLSQLQQFIDSINERMKCRTSQCHGRLIPVKYILTGLGGAAIVKFACDGCSVTIDYNSSAMSGGIMRHNVVSLALRLAAFLAGIGFSGYHRLFGRYLGIPVITDKYFYQVIELAFPHIENILDEICESAKSDMKALPTTQLGSWKRAVTTSDGCWHIRGFFSQNSTFIIRNYLTGALLWYGHVSMRGADKVVTDDLYQGTAKSAEGYLASVLFNKAHEEGCEILINWQDQDSSSEKSFREVYSEGSSARVMKCGGHVSRSHGNALKDLKLKKTFTVDYKRRHAEKFPQVESVSCCCKGKRHKAGCGCISDAFVQSAKCNLFCAITQCENSASNFAERMHNLGRYHARGIHQWDGGQCDFHPLLVCSCGKCTSSDELQCAGKEYVSKSVLRCEFHALAYEIECDHRAEQAAEVIDPDLGRGHSNLCESTFSVLTKFRPKDTNLHRMHYQASTNLGLIQSNMTYLFKKRGSEYHWATDLYERMGLPQLEGMKEICQQDNMRRMEKLKKKKLESVVRGRVMHKCKRAEEQQKRKAWVKQQRITHSYGLAEEEEEYMDQSDLVETVRNSIASGSEHHPEFSSVPPPLPRSVVVTIGGKGCKKCGSVTHKRSSHKECPYNKKKLAVTTQQTRAACKKCGSFTHQRSNHKDCPYKRHSKTATEKEKQRDEESSNENEEQEDEVNDDEKEVDDEEEEEVDDEEDVDNEEEEEIDGEEEEEVDDEEEEVDDEEEEEIDDEGEEEIEYRTEGTDKTSEVASTYATPTQLTKRASCKICGSFSHQRSNHRDCPYNKRRQTY